MRLKKFLAIIASFVTVFLLSKSCWGVYTPSITTMRVSPSDERAYYIKVTDEGIDSNKLTAPSSNTPVANVLEHKIEVTDVFPEGLEFRGFETSEDGTFGGFQQLNNSVSCGGILVDDTNESAISEGTWKTDRSEYFYHGIHYYPATREIKFTIEGLQAGCEIDVGINFKAPDSIDDPNTEEVETRRDFINNVQLRTTKGVLDGSLIDIQMWTDYESTTNYYLRYAYQNIPSDVVPQSLPSPVIGVKDQMVTVAPDQQYEGYTFRWVSNSNSNPITEDHQIKLVNTSNYVYGVWEPLGEGEAQELPDRYTVHYEVENAPAWYMAPRDRKYSAGQPVSVDQSVNNMRSTLYDFDGWESDEIDLGDDATFSMPSRDVTLRGNFNDKKFTVTYEFDGDILPPNADELLPEPQQYAPGDLIEAPKDPTADGYLFTGWYLDDGFRMPEQDITVKGRWRQVEGVFAPNLKIELANENDTFKKGETAEFKVTLTNTADYDLSNLLVKELLDGAVFTDGEGYETMNEFALVSQLASGKSITLNAKYVLHDSDSGTITNTVDLISATGRENYALDNKDYRASVDFKVFQNIIPAFIEDIIPENINTGDTITVFAAIIAACSIVLLVIRHLSGGRRASIRTKYALVLVALVAGSTASIVHITQAMNIYTAGGQSITGVYEITTESRWIDYATARIDVRLKSDIQKSQNARDVLYLVNNSRSMVDTLELTQEKLGEAMGDLLSEGDNRAAIMTFNTKTELLTDFTNDASTLGSALNSIETSGHTDMAAALNGVRNFLDNYQRNINRDLIVVLISNALPDYGEDSGALAYYLLKRDYPFVNVAAVQYQMYPGRVLAPYSDRQYFASENEQIEKYEMEDQDEYGFAIKRAQNSPTIFDSLNITEAIDTDNFEIKSIASTFGTINTEGNQVIWNAAGAESGSSIKAQIIVKLKDSAIATEAAEYHLATPLAGSFRIGNKDGNETLGDDVSLHGFSTVEYEVYPTYATVKGEPALPEPTKYLAYSAVPIAETTLYLDARDFVGFTPVSDSLVYSNRDYFVMDDNDVIVRPVWNRAKAVSASDGKTFMASTSYMNTSTAFTNKAMVLAGATENPSNYALKYYDYTIKHYLRASELPEDFVPNTGNTITYNTSSPPVYIWIDGDTLYYYTSGRGKVRVSSATYTFAGFRALEDITGVSEWNTSSLVALTETFGWCNELEDFSPLADWDVRKVKSLGNFVASTKIRSLDFMRNWQLDSLNSLSTAFQSTRYLTDIDALSTIDITNVTSLYYTFQYSGFTDTAPLADWNTSNVTTMKNTFSSNKQLLKLDGLADWNTSSVTNMSSMFFDNCQFESLEPLRGWDVSKVTDMNNMFYCNPGNEPTRLQTLEPIYGWNVQSGTNKSSMFRNINLTLPSWY